MAASRLDQLSARRRALTARSGALRAQVIGDCARVGDSMQVPQLAAAGLRWLTRRPLVAGSVVVGVLVIGPRRVLRFATGAVGAWTLATRARDLGVALWRLLRYR